jgi:hypothetical protein
MSTLHHPVVILYSRMMPAPITTVVFLPQAFSRRSLSTASRAPKRSSFVTVGAMLTDVSLYLYVLEEEDDASGTNAVANPFNKMEIKNNRTPIGRTGVEIVSCDL